MPEFRNVINPGAGPVDIPDVDAYLAGCDPDDPPMVDLGGGMVVPLTELLETHDETEPECPQLAAVLAGRGGSHTDSTCGWCADIRTAREVS